MKYLIISNLVFALLGFSLVSHAGNVAYIYGDISEAGFTPAASATTGSTDPYDQMLLSDTSDNGLSIFKEIVEEQGHSIQQYYDQTTILDANFLSDKDVIVFSLHQKIWSSTEKAALDIWLRNGGGILIYSDSASGGYHRIVGAQNTVGQMATNNLIGAYGIEAMVDQANGAPSIQASATASIVGLRNLTLDAEGVSPIAFAPGDTNVEVLIPYTGPIKTNDGLTISNPDYAALALRPVGQGHIMALFDRQPIWNDGKGANIQDGDNRTIFSTVINFLAENPGDTNNINPVVVIDSPNQSANFGLNDVVNISATAGDEDGSVSSVEFFINGALLSVDSDAPYSALYNATESGDHTVLAVVTDNDGAINSDQVTINVEEGDTPPVGLRPAELPSANLVNGIEYDYFKLLGRLSSTSELVGTPFESGLLVSGPSIAPAVNDLDNTDYYGLIFKGYIEVPASGVYTFYTTSDDGSDLFIGDELIVDNDGSHGAQERSGAIGLEAGFHPITLRYFQGRFGFSFEYAWMGPNLSKQAIPSHAWFAEGTETVTNVKPVVEFTQPLANVEFSVGDSITIAANADDSDGFVSQVEFFVNGNSVDAADTAAPYTAMFNATASGDYVFSVVVTDNDGATNSDQLSVRVNDVIVDTPVGDLRQADQPNSNLLNGVEYDYFKLIGRLSSTSDLVGTPYESGLLVSGPSIEPAVNDVDNVDYYGFIFSGYIEVPENGVYTFYTTSDDGSDLFIGDELIVDNDGSHGAQERSGEIGLEAGFHLITIRYFQGRFGSAFEYAWQGPSFAKQAIPSFVWFVEGEGEVGEPAANVEPVVALSQPLSSTQFTEGDSVAITAAADDSDGFVLQVEFFVNGNLLGNVDTTAPYEVSFNANEPGEYTILAVVTDNDGATSSDQLSIVVDEITVQAPNGLRQAEVLSVDLVNGVEYNYFKQIGRLSSTSDLVGSPYETGLLTSGPSIAPAENDTSNVYDYGFIFNAYINVPQSGVYTFYTTSDDGSVLFIGDEQVVDNDGSHGAQESFGEIGLEAGLHPISIRYFQGRYGSVFDYAWQGPSFIKQAVPVDVWFVEDK